MAEQQATSALAPEEFVEVFSAVPAAVSVVTSRREERLHGTTVSAFCSLSLGPPMALVSLSGESDLLPVVRDAGRFGINVLAHTQHDVARQFAKKGDDKFRGVRWRLDQELPRLDGVHGWIVCEVAGIVTGGEIVLGTVTHAELQRAVPLIYHDRAFATPAVIRDLD
jgi:flavin reductase (DIM6/NTAB) family NADH-FMN oxidoreductase RutF